MEDDMASGNVGDVEFGKPYTGTPVQQASRDNKVQTVLDMNFGVTRTITMHANDDHYISQGVPGAGSLYHE